FCKSFFNIAILKAVESMLKDGTKKININGKDEEGTTGLMWAADNGFSDMVELLIASKADLRSKNFYQFTVLMYVLAKLPPEKAQAIAQSMLKNLSLEDINVQNDFGETALQIAARKGYVSVVEEMIRKGVDLEPKSKEEGFSALALAKKYKHPEVAALIENAIDRRSSLSKFHKAIKEGDLTEVRKYLKVGINLEAISDLFPGYRGNGNTALLKAIKHTSVGRLGIITELLAAGANPNARNKKGYNALSMAILKNDLQKVKALINAKGIDLNIRDKFQQTELIRAVSCNKAEIEIVEALIKGKGINLDAQRDDGGTALMLAVYYNSIAAAKLLIDNGADLDLKNKNGRTALYFAEAVTGNTDMIKLLKEAAVARKSVKAVMQLPPPPAYTESAKEPNITSMEKILAKVVDEKEKAQVKKFFDELSGLVSKFSKDKSKESLSSEEIAVLGPECVGSVGVFSAEATKEIEKLSADVENISKNHFDRIKELMRLANTYLNVEQGSPLPDDLGEFVVASSREILDAKEKLEQQKKLNKEPQQYLYIDQIPEERVPSVKVGTKSTTVEIGMIAKEDKESAEEDLLRLQLESLPTSHFPIPSAPSMSADDQLSADDHLKQENLPPQTKKVISF
ncbi:MAG: ankyrin repeat domain-containing protein, partial [Oligoflexia bacterium]|nr:ankyrin repeat domain-containing protein [Oligoflexia bacterium]